MLLVPREDGERGASVVAALAFVLFFTAFGFVTAVLVADSTVANARSQMLAAAGTNRLAALDPKATGGGSSAVSPVSTDTDGKVGTTKVESKCNAGEVHTVRTVTDAKNVDGKVVTTSSPRDFKAVCLLPDARGAMMPGPQASDPTCKFRSQTQCVVRYCPPVAEGQEEACQIISCKEGASECMKKAMETALTKPPPTAIADLQNQGAAFQTFDGTTVSTQDAVDPNLYKAVEDQQAVYNKQSEISAIDSQITETNKYFDTYKSVCADTGMVGGTTENSYCSTATWEENNKKLLDLNAQKEQAQSQLDQQVADLKNRTTSMYPGTGEWTGVGSGQDVTGGVNGPGYTDYVKQSSADQIVSKCAGSCQAVTPQEYSALKSAGYNCNTDGSCVKSDATGGVKLPPSDPRKSTTFPDPGPGGGGGGGGGGVGSGSGMSSAMQNGLMYGLGYMLGNLLKGNGLFGNQQTQQTPIQCAKTQDEYNQQLQTYNSQIQQYNYQLQQYQYQQQQQSYLGGGTSGLTPIYNSYSMNSAPVGYVQGSNPYGSTATQQPRPPQQPPQPCFSNQNPQQCSYSPQQPASTSCSQGQWKPTTSGNGCVSGWQCVPNSTTSSDSNSTNSGSTANQVAATLSCEPKLLDVGMTLAISFSCQNATESYGSGFSTGGRTSGSATTTISTPPANTNTATYTLTCAGAGGATAGAQCSVQIAKPSVVFVASPAKVRVGEKTVLGWITSGMRSCTVSSAEYPEFTSQNASYNSTSGVATTPNIAGPSTFLLECSTHGGQYVSQTTVVGIIEQTE